MMRLAFILALSLTLVACDRSGEKSSIESIATCVSNAPSDQLDALGRRADLDKLGYPVHLARFDELSCRGVRGVLDNNATLNAQGMAISEKLLPSRDFRRGVQTSAWRANGQPPDRAYELAGLAIQQGENTVTRAWARNCLVLNDDAASGLRDLEAPYLTAYVGIRGWVAEPAQAQALANAIAEQSKTNALFEAAAAGKACSDSGMQQRYASHVSALTSFSQGTNPLVMGCQVQVQAGELALDCSRSAHR